MTTLQKESVSVQSRIIVPFVCGSGVVEIASRDYHVDELPAGWVRWGRGFTLTALPFDRDGEDEIYTVVLDNAQDFGCDCVEFHDSGDCEHCRGILALLAKGEI